MSRRVIFLGLAGEADDFTEAEGRQRADQIWTLNDWYQKLPNVPHPDKVFNIHADITNHAADANRFTGDTIQAYNQSGAEIVTTRHWPELDNCRPFDIQKVLDVRTDPFFNSTLAAMFLCAWIECFDEIEFVGIVLGHDGEFFGQVPSVMGAIIESEKRGIKVIAPHMDTWIQRGMMVINWDNPRDNQLSMSYWGAQHGVTAPEFLLESAAKPLPYTTFPKQTGAHK